MNDRRQTSALAERTDAANDVAGGSCGVGGGRHCDASDPERVSGSLEVERVVDRHEGDGELASVATHDERLEDRARNQAERIGGLQPVGRGIVVMSVAEDFEGDASAFGG